MMSSPPTSRSSLSAAEFEEEALSHLKSLYAVAARLTRRRAEAEDLVQDTFLKAMRARHQFEPGTNMKAWLLRIQTNTFINRYRRGGLERAVVEGPDADPLSDGWISAASLRGMRDPEGTALRPVLEGEIRAALESLPEDFRVAVVLADVEGLGYKEIADAMGCPIGTVMSRLHRGRRLLKSQLVEQARALGIIVPEEDIGATVHAELDDAASVSAASVRAVPVNLDAYRERKRGHG